MLKSTLDLGNTVIPTINYLNVYTTMLQIRMVEEKIANILQNSNVEIVCPCHLYTGQEAIATGVCSELGKNDYVFSTHRSHGHYIAKGGDIKSLFAEIYGKATGCSRGKGGSMHIASPSIGLPGSSAIVAGTISLAVGAALSFSIQKNNNVAIAFFGDGAIDEGVFYEALNFASLKSLPVIFVCENNLYSTHMPITACHADTALFRKAEAFNVPSVRIDGNNVLEVISAASKAIYNARLGKGPTLIECMTYRWRGHVGPNYDIDKGLRSQDEVNYWMNRCPIKNFENYLLMHNVLSITELEQIRNKINIVIDEAVSFAKNSPYPDRERCFDGVYKL